MIVEIKLTQGKVALIDDVDINIVNQYQWSYDPKGYAMTNGKDRRTIRMHRLIMLIPEGMEIDHIDGNGLNNVRNNLRIVTHAENMLNRKLNTNNSSGYKAGTWKADPKKWAAQIQFDGKNHVLGYYEDKLDAAKAYNIAAIKYHNVHARLNKI